MNELFKIIKKQKSIILGVIIAVILFFSIITIFTKEYAVEGKLIDAFYINQTPHLSGPPCLDPIPYFYITIEKVDRTIRFVFHGSENLNLEEIFRYGGLRNKIISAYRLITDNASRYDNETVQWAIDEISSYQESYPEQPTVVMTYTEFFGTKTLTKLEVRT